MFTPLESPCRIAMLALLALAPCARALTVTQSATYFASEAGPGAGLFSLGRTVTFNAADPGLVAVTLDLEMTGIGSVTYDNPFRTGPNDEGPPLTADSKFSLVTIYNFPAPTPERYFGVQGSPVIYTTTYTFTSPFQLSRSDTFTVPALLAHFMGPATVPLTARFHGDTSYGSAAASATSTLTLTYVYATPDGGVSALLFTVPLGLLAFVHRRMKPGMDRRPPTL